MIYINAHEIILDKQERLEAWTSYDRVVHLAMNFVKDCPVDPANGFPWYLQYSCFWTDPLRPTVWPDNPAGKFAWATTTLLKYYPYSGDAAHIAIVRSMLDRLWEYRTPGHYAWPDVPYASALPGTGIYFGARADGEYVTEADKVAQVGRAYIDFYELTGEEKYLKAGRRIAEVLAGRIRPGDKAHSPWPFRVDVRTGTVVEEYTAHMLPAVRLFDELIRLGQGDFQAVRYQVWEWIEKYPLSNNVWKGHFEDIRLDPGNENRDQVSPLETARYLLENQERFPRWKETVRGLIDWVKETLGGHPFFTALPIHEQKYCYFPMGSHTARFASLSAQYGESADDPSYREQAVRSFNWASYMTCEDGTVTVGVDRPDYYNQCWFTDGYFDYVPHFLDGMAVMPGLAPADTDHLLHSTSVVQQISYLPNQVSYRTFDAGGTQKLRLTFPPVQIQAGSQLLVQQEQLKENPGWVFDSSMHVLTIKPGSRNVVIQGR